MLFGTNQRRLCDAATATRANDRREDRIESAVLALPPRVFRSDAWLLSDEPLLGFIEVPAGGFLMGLAKKDGYVFPDERRHRVHLPAFYIGRYPVTVAQFRACVEDGGCESKRKSKTLRTDADNSAVRNISWFEALKYCAWIEAKLRAWPRTPRLLAEALGGQRPGARWHITLPSEAEWEKAAEGTTGRVAAWGNLDSERTDDSVGSIHGGTSPYGALDMTGSRLSEWTRSRPEKYPYVPLDGREDLEVESKFRVARGGSGGDLAFLVRHRGRYEAAQRIYVVGFRLALSQVR